MKCSICYNSAPVDSISLKGIAICHACEKHIVDIDVNDPEYEEILTKIKEVWVEYVCRKE